MDETRHHDRQPHATAAANRDSGTCGMSEDLIFTTVMHAPPLSLFLSLHQCNLPIAAQSTPHPACSHGHGAPLLRLDKAWLAPSGRDPAHRRGARAPLNVARGPAPGSSFTSTRRGPAPLTLPTRWRGAVLPRCRQRPCAPLLRSERG
jgi:hypothetical protein